MTIQTEKTLLAIERVINMIRKKLYNISSLNILMNDTDIIMNVSFDENANKQVNIKKQLEKIIEVKKITI